MRTSLTSLLLLGCGSEHRTGPPVDTAPVDSPQPLDSAEDSPPPASDSADSPPPPTPTASLSLGRSTNGADGRDSSAVMLQLGAGATHPPILVPSLGSLSTWEALGEGRYTATWQAGTWPGEGSLSADGWELEGERILLLEEPPGHSAQLHLHGSLSEGDGTMNGHGDAAERLGLDLLWWTDHDLFYYPDHFMELQGLNFDEGEMGTQIPAFPAGTEVSLGWVQVEAGLPLAEALVQPESASAGAGGLRLRAQGNGVARAQARWAVEVTPDLHFKSVLGDVILTLDLRPQALPEGSGLCLTVPVSQSRVGGESSSGERALRFYLSDEDRSVESSADVVWLPLAASPGEWTRLELDISALVAEAWPELEGDAHAEFVQVELWATGEETVQIDLDELRWTQAIVGEELRQRQLDWLAGSGRPLTQHVGMELSELLEGHFNAFGANIPFQPYADDPSLDARRAVELIHAEGGLVSYNHMFGVSGGEASAEARAEAVDERSEALLASEVWGADLLEVGYRQRGGRIEDFLQVWDRLGLAGLIITGIGVSDQHDEYPMTTSANRFVTWIGAASDDEAELLAALARGNAWFGDPNALGGAEARLTFTLPALRLSAGQALAGLSGEQELLLVASPLRPGWTMQILGDGLPLCSAAVEVDGEGELRCSADLGALHLLRAQILDEEGQGLLYSNPIYLLPEGVEPPAHRLPRP